MTNEVANDRWPACNCAHCKDPQGAGLLFRHWTKDPNVPYLLCSCATCKEARDTVNI